MSISCEIISERRPFKSHVFSDGEGVQRDYSMVANPGHINRPTTRRPFKALEFVATEEDTDSRFCTTRYFDSDGNQLWHKNHGATVRSVGLDAEGYVYEAGSPTSSGITLRKRGPDGRLLWSRKHGAALNSCAVTSDGGVVVGGVAGTGGATVRKYDADGELLWSRSTFAKVVKVAVDELDAVAALEQRDSEVWTSLMYAFTSGGVPGETQGFGGLAPGDRYTYTTAIKFGGQEFRNRPEYRGTFYNRLLIGYTQWLIALQYTQSQIWTQEGFGSVIGQQGDDALTTAYPGTLNELCMSHGDVGDDLTHWAAATSVEVVALNYYSELTVSQLAFYYPGYPDFPHDPGYYDRISLSNNFALCSTLRHIFTGSTIFQRFSVIEPKPTLTFTGPLYKKLSDWQYSHHGVIWGCDALESGNSVIGGAVATI